MSKNAVEKVAIVGAGGWIGRHITQALLATGKHSVTALTRNGSTSAIPAGVHHTAVVDYANPASVAAALRGHDCLVITLSIAAPPNTSKLLYEAAQAAGVPWVMPNCWGGTATNPELTRDQGVRGAFDAAIADSTACGLRPIVLSLSFWYEFSLAGGVSRYGFDIPARRVVFFDDGTQKIHTTTWPQCGRAVAAVLSLPVTAADGEPSITAYSAPNHPAVFSFFVSQKDMFESLKRVTKTTDADWTISHQPSKARFEAAQNALAAGGGTNVDGSPLDPMEAFAQRMYTRIFYPGGDGYPEITQNEALGLPKEDLDEWTQVAIDMVNNNTLASYGRN